MRYPIGYRTSKADYLRYIKRLSDGAMYAWTPALAERDGFRECTKNGYLVSSMDERKAREAKAKEPAHGTGS